MMAPQQFCVRWNSHQSNLQSAFPKLLTNEHFADVTLACEARSIRCHKVVLSACSAYFESLLVSNPCQHPIVFMKDMRYRDLRALVDFMYRGEVNVSQEELASLLRAAEALQIRGLSGSDQEVATAPVGSLPTNLPPDISVRNGPITPATGQSSPPQGSGNSRRSLHKRRRNLTQQATSSSSPPVSGDSQRNAQRDEERRASDDDADAADEVGESESPRPRTHGEIQVRGDLHDPMGAVDDEALKDDYEEDGGVDLDTVKTEHDYGHQSMDNSAAGAGENEDDLDEEDEEEGDILQTEGEGRSSEHQSVHYHHMLDVPGPSGYTPQTAAPPQEKMTMGEVTDPATLALQSVTCEISPGGWPAIAPETVTESYSKLPPVNNCQESIKSEDTTYCYSQRKRAKKSQELISAEVAEEEQSLSTFRTSCHFENRIDRLKHFVNTYKHTKMPISKHSEYGNLASLSILSSGSTNVLDSHGAVVTLIPQHRPADEINCSEAVGGIPVWFSAWSEKKDRYDREFQDEIHEKLDIILRNFQLPEVTATPKKKIDNKTKLPDCLPLKTMQEFKEFNKHLADNPNFKQSLVTFLKSLGANSTKQAVVNFFGKCMEDELMCNFTWAGHTRTKSELQSTPLAKCIIETVRNIETLNMPSFAECQKYGSEAVRYANQRRNQWRAAREREQQQIMTPIIQYDPELVDQPDDFSEMEEKKDSFSDSEKFIFSTSSTNMPVSTGLPHNAVSGNIVPYSTVPSYLIPSRTTMPIQQYSSGSRRNIHDVPSWSVQEHVSYQHKKIPLPNAIPVSPQAILHNPKRQHLVTAPAMSAKHPELSQSQEASILPLSSPETNVKLINF